VAAGGRKAGFLPLLSGNKTLKNSFDSQRVFWPRFRGFSVGVASFNVIKAKNYL
jgi:hypothetical protein